MVKVADKVRSLYIKELFDYFANKGEDVGMIASNSFNLPLVMDGEELFLEVVVKVPKDSGDDNYLKRDTYADKVREREERKVKAEAKKKTAEKEKTE